ncbi:MAG: thioesterase [Bacteroidetes bacterium]|nr:thioesterase [Bacteroidota bacterium]
MSISKFQKQVNNRFLMRLFLLKSLPMAFFARIRVKHLDDREALTLVRYGWLTQNPFRSMYFACQAMAAEMSTGLLVMNGIYGSKPGISMLIIKNEAGYFKKATGLITFTCSEGEQIAAAILKAKESGEGVTIPLKSVGKDESGEVVSEFIFTWSLKAKSK